MTINNGNKFCFTNKMKLQVILNKNYMNLSMHNIGKKLTKYVA